MTINVAINGFGRIGRLVLRSIIETKRNDIQVAAINDLGSAEQSAHLLKYDSVHGHLAEDISASKSSLKVGSQSIPFFAERNPEALPWKDLDVDVTLECSGHFASHDKASKHLTAGAKKVLISAPASGVPLTVVYGVNHDKIAPDHKVISNASCTTNCLAPVAYALQKEVGIDHGFMTTIHAFTGDQSLVDSLHKDPRRARAATLSMIPTSTGAARAVGLVLPELDGKLDGTAVRVPTPNVSMVDLKFVSSRPTSSQEINDIFTSYSKGKLKGVMGICEVPLVSSDFNHSSLSSIADLTQTQVIDGTFCRVLSWYDNEWGFSNRMCDTAVALAKA